MADQVPLLPPDHVSFQPRRLRRAPKDEARVRRVVAPERVYAAEWKRLNHHGTGPTLLARVLAADGQAPGVVSRRDAAVAASVVQWLGTNVGLAFMRTCERKIAEARRAAGLPEVEAPPPGRRAIRLREGA